MDYKEVISKCINFKIKKSSRIITRFIDKRLQGFEIKITQYHLLAAIGQYGNEKNLTEISNLIGSDRTTITRNLQPLIKAGLIKCWKSDDDKRLYRFCLTDKGEQIFDEAFKVWKETNLYLSNYLKTKNLFSISEEDLYTISKT